MKLEKGWPINRAWSIKLISLTDTTIAGINWPLKPAMPVLFFRNRTQDFIVKKFVTSTIGLFLCYNDLCFNPETSHDAG
ncbi:hypothetical protein ELQ35_10065 [Peribacillus cavernae]|uniref:Uncharacterized protein n=1 Tax=Peribacillus cavernae TaxID=1674310 RepID=A0A3S0U1S8_9BACI|nr:hypothetical protein [Peribacillus cavernae]MDQ0218992.1 hypothetical protein [Peribacillus cavernae]RUQ29302.1 hypothetical protein ELQ35_10065 [Peribacillus cavernae]